MGSAGICAPAAAGAGAAFVVATSAGFLLYAGFFVYVGFFGFDSWVNVATTGLLKKGFSLTIFTIDLNIIK